jgi:uncharacterized protein (TIGR00369 family)
MSVMSQDFTKQMNEMPEGWLQAMGVTITRATQDEVRAELTVGPEHLQSYGIVHGGVHCGLIESMASIGAALYAFPRGQSVVGLENNTSFIRAVRAGASLDADHPRPQDTGVGGAGPRRGRADRRHRPGATSMPGGG